MLSNILSCRNNYEFDLQYSSNILRIKNNIDLRKTNDYREMPKKRKTEPTRLTSETSREATVPSGASFRSFVYGSSRSADESCT